MENQIISDLEKENPKFLFYNRKAYNRVEYLNVFDKKIYIMMCRNFFVEMQDEHNMKIKTIKYWFLHNISLLIQQDLELINDFLEISDEFDILIDYFRVTLQSKERTVDKFIFLPIMRFFSNWCNLSNKKKIEVHHYIIRDLIYLDDNYFFLINYFKNHNDKFIINIVKNHYEMENGNNIMIHLIRSANFKNCYCSLRNFKRLINYLFLQIWDNKFMEIMLKKNKNGKRAINLLVYLKEYFYEFILNRIFLVSTHKEFMEKYFTCLTKYINHSFQLEYILDSVDISFPEKYDNLYEKIVKNKTIAFYEKYLIINLLRQYNLVSIENDKEKLGRKMWEELHK